MTAIRSLSKTLATGGDKFYENEIINLCSNHLDVKINLIWVPAHVGIYGNEKADSLAIYRRAHTGTRLLPKTIYSIVFLDRFFHGNQLLSEAA